MIGLNTAVFGAWQIADYTKDRDLMAKLNKHAVLSQSNLEAGRYYTFITSAFSHKDPIHFIFNMVRITQNFKKVSVADAVAVDVAQRFWRYRR